MNTLRITKKMDWFKEISFVSRAIAKNSPMWRGKSYNFIYIQNGIASATDKYRCHQAFVGIEDGVYEVVKCAKTEIILQLAGENKTYADPANWERPYPEHKDCKYADLKGIQDIPWYEWGHAAITKLLPEDKGIQQGYLKDLEEGMTAYIYAHNPHVVCFVDEVTWSMWAVACTFQLDFDPEDE